MDEQKFTFNSTFLENICQNLSLSSNNTYSNLSEIFINFNTSQSINTTDIQEGFNYSLFEKLIMGILNSTSNFGIIPCIILVIKYKKDVDVFLGLLTFFSSFMYHLCDGLDVDIYMKEGEWHQIDNIGSICSITSFLLALSNYSQKVQIRLNLLFLLLIIIVQFADPWNLINTIFPIILAFLTTLYSFSFKRNGGEVVQNKVESELNKVYNSKGKFVFSLAFVCFLIGINEHYDYLRIFHSLWHILIGYSTYYIRLTKDQNKEGFDYYSEMFYGEKPINYIHLYINDI